MAKAKTLNKAELKPMLNYNDAHEYYRERNRAIILFTHLCGMRIREVVKLKVSDVIDYINKVKK
jgi:integrase/recombinase XerD